MDKPTLDMRSLVAVAGRAYKRDNRMASEGGDAVVAIAVSRINAGAENRTLFFFCLRCI